MSVCRDEALENKVGDVDVTVPRVLVIALLLTELRSVCGDEDERCVADAVIVMTVLVMALLLAV